MALQARTRSGLVAPVVVGVVVVAVMAAMMASTVHAACNPSERWYDGGCNNLGRPALGKARTAFLRGPEGVGFEDGLTAMRAGPNARTISQIVGDDTGTPRGNARNLTGQGVYWGQWTAHDLAFTRPMVPVAGEDGEITISVAVESPDDPFYGTGNASVVIDRTHLVPDHAGVGQVVNEISHFFDLGQVYSSDEAVIHRLRAHHGGKMRTASYVVEDETVRPGKVLVLKNQLPNSHMVGIDTVEGLAGNNPVESHLVGGDFRVIENAVLAHYHLLFVREHNRYAGIVAHAHPTWTDEQIFQRARDFTIATYQHIMFDEYLRALVGDVFYAQVSQYEGYDADVNPSVSLLFATAAFRFGHSMIPERVPVYDYAAKDKHIGSLPLAGLFHNELNPLTVNLITDGPHNLAYSLARFGARAIDGKLADAMRSFPGNFDVYAANLMRGRMNGLPAYDRIVQTYGPMGESIYARPGCAGSDADDDDADDALACFREVCADVATAERLRAAYGKVKRIDAFVGLLIEKPVAGSAFGLTETAVIVDQFRRSRDGDRFWYENLENGRFTAAEVAAIRERSLADVIADNYDVPRDRLQADGNVFLSSDVLANA